MFNIRILQIVITVVFLCRDFRVETFMMKPNALTRPHLMLAFIAEKDCNLEASEGLD